MLLDKTVGYVVFTLCLVMASNFLHAKPRDVSDTTSAEQRLEYLEKLFESRSGQRLVQYNKGDIAQQLHRMLDQARTAIAAGNEKKADDLTKKVVKIFMKTVRELPAEPEEIARFKVRYEALRSGLEKFIDAQKENKERFSDEKNSAREYSKIEVNKLLKQADIAADTGHYEKAISDLNQAQSIVTQSLQGMLNNKQLVRKFDISTPEKEYFYELRRYQGYEGLIPVAIDVKKPGDLIQKTMMELDNKARWMFEEARNKASKGDYPVAIRMMMDATGVIRQALRLVDAAI